MSVIPPGASVQTKLEGLFQSSADAEVSAAKISDVKTSASGNTVQFNVEVTIGGTTRKLTVKTSDADAMALLKTGGTDQATAKLWLEKLEPMIREAAAHEGDEIEYDEDTHQLSITSNGMTQTYSISAEGKNVIAATLAQPDPKQRLDYIDLKSKSDALQKDINDPAQNSTKSANMHAKGIIDTQMAKIEGFVKHAHTAQAICTIFENRGSGLAATAHQLAASPAAVSTMSVAQKADLDPVSLLKNPDSVALLTDAELQNINWAGAINPENLKDAHVNLIVDACKRKIPPDDDAVIAAKLTTIVTGLRKNAEHLNLSALNSKDDAYKAIQQQLSANITDFSKLSPGTIVALAKMDHFEPTHPIVLTPAQFCSPQPPAIGIAVGKNPPLQAPFDDPKDKQNLIAVLSALNAASERSSVYNKVPLVHNTTPNARLDISALKSDATASKALNEIAYDRATPKDVRVLTGSTFIAKYMPHSQLSKFGSVAQFCGRLPFLGKPATVLVHTVMVPFAVTGLLWAGGKLASGMGKTWTFVKPGFIKAGGAIGGAFSRMSMPNKATFQNAANAVGAKFTAFKSRFSPPVPSTTMQVMTSISSTTLAPNDLGDLIANNPLVDIMVHLEHDTFTGVSDDQIDAQIDAFIAKMNDRTFDWNNVTTDHLNNLNAVANDKLDQAVLNALAGNAAKLKEYEDLIAAR